MIFCYGSGELRPPPAMNSRVFSSSDTVIMPLFAQVCILLSFRGTRRREHGHDRRAARLSRMASALQQQSSCSEAKARGSALAIVLIATVDPALDSDHGAECWVKCLRLVPLARAEPARVWSNRIM